MEEYLSSIAEEDYLHLWQVPPTVIFGRNQVMASEVNIPYCESHGIQMYRHKSGGGCVYSDMGNLMISYITPNRSIKEVFTHYLDMMVGVLSSLGFEAVRSENNDIMIGGRKVSAKLSVLRLLAALFMVPCYLRPTLRKWFEHNTFNGKGSETWCTIR